MRFNGGRFLRAMFLVAGLAFPLSLLAKAQIYPQSGLTVFNVNMGSCSVSAATSCTVQNLPGLTPASKCLGTESGAAVSVGFNVVAGTNAATVTFATATTTTVQVACWN